MPKRDQQPNASFAEREARKAAALRENLRKRKEQQNLRAAETKE